MRPKIILFTVSISLILSAYTFTGKPKYKELKGASYLPLIKGQKKTFKVDLRTYIQYFDTTTIEINGKTYIKSVIDYGPSQSRAYYREENQAVYYLKQGEMNETTAIPTNPVVGDTWLEGDSSWKYTIIGTNEIFETPESVFSNCLVIQSENNDKIKYPNHYRLYLQYYQRGRGYVGTKIGGQLYSYFTLNN